MPVGKLDRRVTLQSPTSSTGSGGGVSTTWTTAATVWAEVKPLKAREVIAARQTDYQADVVFRIRWRDDIDRTWRIVHDDRPHDIVAMAEVGRRRFLELTAVERRAENA